MDPGRVDGIARVTDVRHFFSYRRLVPGAKNSGGKSRPKRTKDGNRYLKPAFSHAAARAVRHVLAKRRDFNGTFKGAALSRTKKLRWPRAPSPAA